MSHVSHVSQSQCVILRSSASMLSLSVGCSDQYLCSMVETKGQEDTVDFDNTKKEVLKPLVVASEKALQKVTDVNHPRNL